MAECFLVEHLPPNDSNMIVVIKDTTNMIANILEWWCLKMIVNDSNTNMIVIIVNIWWCLKMTQNPNHPGETILRF